MKDKQQIQAFIKNITEQNYAAADKVLGNIVDTKIQKRIKSADSVLANKSAQATK